jgi:hypothetical protein
MITAKRVEIRSGSVFILNSCFVFGGQPFHLLTKMRKAPQKHFVVVRVVVCTVRDTAKSPSVDLPRKGGVTTVTKVERNDSLFKGLVAHDPPSTAVRKPGDNIFELWICEDLMEFHGEGLSGLF